MMETEVKTMNRQLTMDSRIKEVFAHPVGHDILAKVLLQTGMSSALIDNPVVGNMKLKYVFIHGTAQCIIILKDSLPHEKG